MVKAEVFFVPGALAEALLAQVTAPCVAIAAGWDFHLFFFPGGNS